jgi:uncharacterized protein (TIGR01777 family)
MKIILLGGSGLIGKALALELMQAGHSVWILSRRPQQVSVPVGAVVRAWDGRSVNGWLDLAEQADAIVNLAGENIGGGLWTAERKQRILSSRLDAGRAVVDAVEKTQHKPAVVIQSSAVGIYGPVEAAVCTENSPLGSDFLARTAVKWEESSLAVEALGVRRIVIRTGLVLDPHDGILRRFMLPFQLFCGGPMGSGHQVVSWIHIRDLVQAMRFLLENPDAHGVYNLCAPGPVTNAEFGKEIARALRRPYWLPAPAFALRMALGEMSTLVLDGQRALPNRLLAEGYAFTYSGLRIALDNLFHGSSK